LVKTEIVISRTNKFRDTSLIVKGFTKDFGIMSFLGKGARDPKSRLSASLQPFVRSSLVFYKKRSRDLHLLSQAELLESFPGVELDLQHLAYAGAALEMLELLQTSEDPDESLFLLLIEYLRTIEHVPSERLRNTFLSFLLRGCAAAGLRPEFMCCVSCRRVDSLPYFAPVDGGFLCRRCAAAHDGHFQVSDSAALHLRKLCEGELKHVSDMDPGVRRELEKITLSFLQFHIHGYRELRSLRLLKQTGIGIRH
jgi:DNA repair protein RecO (recombination protein O)